MNMGPVSRQLYDGTVDFVLKHRHPDVQRFRRAVEQGIEELRKVKPNHLPAADYLTLKLSSGDQDIDRLLHLYASHKGKLKWEQSYKKADGVVGEDMLSGYGFAEIIGKQGPFVSNSVRCGIGVWGPHVDYPRHTHKAEETYLVMSGAAYFKVGEAPEEFKSFGDVIFVESMAPHGFKTVDQALVVFYLWQSGDLREKSTFV
ncbi:MAG: dimethylsulfonioproprionate lyase family protein [bacterium]